MKIFIMIEDFIISTWFLSLWLIEPNTTLSLQQKIKRRQHTKKLQTYDYCQNFFPQFLSNPLLNKLQSFFSCFREDIPHRSTTSSTCCVTLFVRPISLQAHTCPPIKLNSDQQPLLSLSVSSSNCFFSSESWAKNLFSDPHDLHTELLSWRRDRNRHGFLKHRSVSYHFPPIMW